MAAKASTPKPAKAKVDDAAASLNVPRPRLHKLKVSNFRSIGSVPVEIELDEIVVLVGPNNSGKSSILRAYEVVMKHGSDDGKLTLEDFPNGEINPQQLPTIELETIVFEDTAPGAKWIRLDPQTQEKHVRERWSWADIGAPKRVGWEVATGDWHASEGPWGAPNVAQAYRPKAHRVGAFQKPEELAAQVVELLSKAITERTKELSKKKAVDENTGARSDYEMLIDSITKLRLSIAGEATAAVADVITSLTETLDKVFPGYSVTFDAKAEDDVEKALNIYKPNPVLKMGPSGGFQASLERQGSGTCRTLIWAALRILAERTDAKTEITNTRPNLLLMDEPEICLHPDAIREACRVLYDLPKTKNWQVMITTHSPVFIDLSRPNTSIARVERLATGVVRGTTIFRPKNAKLDEDEGKELKLLNLCDPYVAEFFFGGRTILVEGDTEYTAFKYVMDQEPLRYPNIHVVRARGKSCLVALCKVLNQFDKSYAVLHDADSEKIIGTKTGTERKNSAWTENLKILGVTEEGRKADKVRIVASLPNFEKAYFDEVVDGDKPYFTLARLKDNADAYSKVATLLDALVDSNKNFPVGAVAWSDETELRNALATVQIASSPAKGSND